MIIILSQANTNYYIQTEKDTVLAQAKELEAYCIGVEDELQLQQSQAQTLAAENENLKLEVKLQSLPATYYYISMLSIDV